MGEIKKIRSVIKKYNTPFYLYDALVIRDTYSLLRENIPGEIDIFYAIKANPNKNIVSRLARLGAGADVASAGELKIALEAGVRPDDISFAGPGKTEEELRYAVKMRIGAISIESLEEAMLLEALSKKMKRKAKITLRVNPSLGSQRAGIRMGGGSQQFGIDEEVLPDVLKMLSGRRNLSFTGLHMHTGSQILSEEVIAENMAYMIDLSEKINSMSGAPVNWINFGGGMGIPYYKGQKALNVKKLGRLMRDVLKKAKEGGGERKIRYIIEPGRYLVGTAGFYITKVLFKKESRGKTFLIVDGGMHHNLAAAGLLGEGIRRNREIVAVTAKKSAKKETVTVAGCLCTPLDILARDIELPRCESGDYMYIKCSGAYGYSASPFMFLSHKVPAEVIV
jgi:diaminopimelate decarboxylase